jgi:hypothetical protein
VGGGDRFRGGGEMNSLCLLVHAFFLSLGHCRDGTSAA